MAEATLQGIWTQKGLDKETAFRAGGERKKLTHVAVGDGNGSIPLVSAAQTGLVNEVWRGLANAVMVNPDDPTDLLVDVVIPNNVGGFWIREWGIFDEDGDLVAVGPHDEMHKPLISTGQAAEFLERFHLPSANATFVEIKITSQALATQQYVESKISEHDADAEAHETLARKSVQIKAGTGLMGGGTLEADRTLTVKYGTGAGTACQGNDARVTASEAFRLSMIGVPRYWRSTTLPAGHVWANGDLALFADWPELKKIYDAGGFAGMLLAYNANSATIAANLGKWRPNAANPTGLYVPNLSEQFFRAWTGGSRAAGSWQGDAIRELSGRIDLSRMGSAYTSEASPSTGVLQIEKDALPGLLTSNGTSEFWMWGKASFSASRVAPTAEENRPLNIALPVVLYLGIHA